MSALPDPLAPPEGYGTAPAQLRKNGPMVGGADDGRCDVQARGLPPPFPPQRCGQPAIIRKFIGCAHEHVGYVDLCEAHQHSTNTYTTCGRCAQAGEVSRISVIRTEHLKPRP